MPSAAPPPSIYQPTATHTDITASGPSIVSARPSVVNSAAGEPFGFPTRISLDQRNSSPQPTHYLNSTALQPSPKSDSITIEPSKYPESANGPEPTAVSLYTEAELACIEAWSQGPHNHRPPCTQSEKDQARQAGETIKKGAMAFAATSVLTLGAVGVYQTCKTMRGRQGSGGLEAGYDGGGEYLLLHDKTD